MSNNQNNEINKHKAKLNDFTYFGDPFYDLDLIVEMYKRLPADEFDKWNDAYYESVFGDL